MDWKSLSQGQQKNASQGGGDFFQKYMQQYAGDYQKMTDYQKHMSAAGGA